MNILDLSRDYVKKVLIEALTLYHIVRNKRVRWFVKALLVAPIIYIVSPIDIVPDALPIIGQIDDILVVRAALFLTRRILAPDITSECRDQSEQLLSAEHQDRLRIYLVITATWIILITLAAVYLFKKYARSHLTASL